MKSEREMREVRIERGWKRKAAGRVRERGEERV
jgi:hypothetical protein